mmetsp:Transcript_29710/g.45697  ORF Transcript_29710/g.45697 Transcript_29710/m.45697 type:complete len:297 (+) Transcript_29710:596-1486(+)
MMRRSKAFRSGASLESASRSCSCKWDSFSRNSSDALAAPERAAEERMDEASFRMSAISFSRHDMSSSRAISSNLSSRMMASSSSGSTRVALRGSATHIITRRFSPENSSRNGTPRTMMSCPPSRSATRPASGATLAVSGSIFTPMMTKAEILPLSGSSNSTTFPILIGVINRVSGSIIAPPTATTLPVRKSVVTPKTGTRNPVNGSIMSRLSFRGKPLSSSGTKWAYGACDDGYESPEPVERLQMYGRGDSQRAAAESADPTAKVPVITSMYTLPSIGMTWPVSGWMQQFSGTETT